MKKTAPQAPLSRSATFREQMMAEGIDIEELYDVDTVAEEDAELLAFDATTNAWGSTAVKIKVARRMFAYGNKYGAIRMKDLVDGRVKVLKKSLGEVTDDELYDDVKCHALGELCSKLFRQASEEIEPFTVGFMPRFIYKLTQRTNRPKIMCEELLTLRDDFVKRDLSVMPSPDASREDVIESHIWAAFQYFTYLQSQRGMVFERCDVVSGIWMNPVIHSNDQTLGGPADGGPAAVQRWASMFANKYTKLFGNAPAGATTPRPSKEELLQMEFEDLLSLMKAFGCFGHSNTTADASPDRQQTTSLPRRSVEHVAPSSPPPNTRKKWTVQVHRAQGFVDTPALFDVFNLYVKVIVGDADSMNRREFKTQVREKAGGSASFEEPFTFEQAEDEHFVTIQLCDQDTLSGDGDVLGQGQVDLRTTTTHDSVGVKVKDKSGELLAKVLVTFSPHPAAEAKRNITIDTLSSERAGLLPSGPSPAEASLEHESAPRPASATLNTRPASATLNTRAPSQTPLPPPTPTPAPVDVALRLHEVVNQSFSSGMRANSPRREAFEKSISQDLAAATGAVPEQFEIVRVSGGSVGAGRVIIECKVHPSPAGCVPYPDPMSVATALEKQAGDPQSPLRSGLLTRHLQGLALPTVRPGSMQQLLAYDLPHPSPPPQPEGGMSGDDAQLAALKAKLSRYQREYGTKEGSPSRPERERREYSAPVAFVVKDTSNKDTVGVFFSEEKKESRSTPRAAVSPVPDEFAGRQERARANSPRERNYVSSPVPFSSRENSPSRRLKERTYIDNQHSGELSSGKFARGDSPVGRQRSRTYVDKEVLSDSLSQGMSARADALGALRAAPGDAAAPAPAHAAARKQASANNAGGWQGVASLPPGEIGLAEEEDSSLPALFATRPDLGAPKARGAAGKPGAPAPTVTFGGPPQASVGAKATKALAGKEEVLDPLTRRMDVAGGNFERRLETLKRPAAPPAVNWGFYRQQVS